ncbi:Integral membrane protein [Weissella sp. DD23]|nr:Integral membrane protein [Weissella sp. DD23]
MLLLLINVPLMITAYRKIGKRFAMFTAVALVLAAVAMRLVSQPEQLWTHDPLVMAIFGGAVNGFGTGLALRNGLSTGGLDIIGILVRRKTGMKMGAVNLTFNFFILLASGFLFGPQYALYTGIGLVVNARVIDLVYTRQQKMQVMIVTEKPDLVIEAIQRDIRRGITIVHHAEGGYNHHHKEVLFTVISMYEQYDLRDAIYDVDPQAWASLWRIDRTFGRFYEPKL